LVILLLQDGQVVVLLSQVDDFVDGQEVAFILLQVGLQPLDVQEEDLLILVVFSLKDLQALADQVVFIPFLVVDPDVIPVVGLLVQAVFNLVDRLAFDSCSNVSLVQAYFPTQSLRRYLRQY